MDVLAGGAALLPLWPSSSSCLRGERVEFEHVEVVSAAMPTYEYQCQSCGARFEAWQKITDDPIETCPTCGNHVRRVIYPVGLMFKGSGFYSTDNRSSGASSSHSTTSSPSTETSGSSASKSSAEPAASKPAASASE